MKQDDDMGLQYNNNANLLRVPPIPILGNNNNNVVQQPPQVIYNNGLLLTMQNQNQQAQTIHNNGVLLMVQGQNPQAQIIYNNGVMFACNERRCRCRRQQPQNNNRNNSCLDMVLDCTLYRLRNINIHGFYNLYRGAGMN